MIDGLKKEVIKEGREIQGSVQNLTVSYIVAGLGFVAGLAWNDAIKALLDIILPLDKNKVGAQFIYAIVVTIIVVIVSTYLIRLSRRK